MRYAFDDKTFATTNYFTRFPITTVRVLEVIGRCPISNGARTEIRQLNNRSMIIPKYYLPSLLNSNIF
jgi:hypothetical protein